MEKSETWETVLPGGNDFTSKNFHQWKSAVLKHTDMSESRLRKLWRLGFTPEAIAKDEHHAVYPPDKASRARQRAGISEGQLRGKNLGDKRISWMYASALCDVAEGILRFHSLDPATRDRIMKELEGFKALMIKYSHKGA